MRLSTNWTRLMNATTKPSEQSRRENDGRKHSETRAINAEIAGDLHHEAFKRYVSKPSIDKARINAAIKFQHEQIMHDRIRAAFGPRLVKEDGTIRFTFQCKK